MGVPNAEKKPPTFTENSHCWKLTTSREKGGKEASSDLFFWESGVRPARMERKRRKRDIASGGRKNPLQHDEPS